MRTQRRLFFASLVVVVAACGSRTGLLVPLDLDGGVADVGPDARHREAGQDAQEEDALPPIDVRPPVDVFNDCPDAASTLVYVISSSNNLYSFYPPTATFTQIGTISCPAQPGDLPFSMAVDRTGIAYVAFQQSGDLFRVSTATAACQPTAFTPRQRGFSTNFGMGFSKDLMGTGETLYVASGAGTAGAPPAEIATIDTKTFALNIVGTTNPPIYSPELTGTGAGDLFGFYALNGGVDSAIGQIDKTNAAVVGESVLTGVAQGNGWAFAFWGGDFYTFTAPNGTNSVVTRFRPSDGSVTQVAATPDIIVGAGVSTCAPQG